ncbi:MAG: hypothetical protein K1563_16045 [Candidatus Thiodiazotropha sp. (ex. Lucinisca nassula)]|nr:hypothetical protein [Candidatus Thiodiazotropha sp. (ex. Lucinisca nassula)]MBW9275193.1 hypothetical protein [Candidatus Thiodiazotropha sp. (ex. Lucinisca nassula)]
MSYARNEEFRSFTGHTSAKAQCELEKKAEAIICEGEKSTAKALCETAKVGLHVLSRTGNLANVDGFAQAQGQLRVCVPKVVFDSTLSNLVMTLAVEGQVNASIGVEWVPLDIVGHVACVVPWTHDKDLKVTVPLQDVDIQSGLQYVEKDESLWITADVQTSDLKAEMKPKPRDLILTNYNMQLACPLLGSHLVTKATLLVAASEAIPELNGKFVFHGEKRRFEFEVEPILGF